MEDPADVKPHRGFLAGGQDLLPPDRRLMGQQHISGVLFPAPRTAAQTEPVLASNLIKNPSRTAPGQAGAAELRAELGPGFDPPLSLFHSPCTGKVLPADSRARGKNICSDICQVTAVSADGLFLRTCWYLPTHSCQLIRVTESQTSPLSTKFCRGAF